MYGSVPELDFFLNSVSRSRNPCVYCMLVYFYYNTIMLINMVANFIYVAGSDTRFTGTVEVLTMALGVRAL